MILMILDTFLVKLIIMYTATKSDCLDLDLKLD